MTSVKAPHQSMADTRGKCETCRVRATMNSATRPTGTLTRNTQRQPVMPRIESAWAKNPPMIGPSTDDVPKTARKYPWYLARSRGGTMSPMIASASENNPPAPMPWTARNAAS